MVYCETCGTENNNSAKFCKSCGTTLSPSTQQKINHPPLPRGDISIGFGNRSTGENLVLRCSLCGSQDFAKDSGRLDSKWGWTSFKVIMLSCKRCGHIELFNKGRSIWDFD
ncbi:MAG: double zinc ribbon domain-containing protein [Promethearchaeota archaeon]